MTNNNQLFFLFKIMTYNSHLFLCVWKHDKLGGGCLVFTSFYGSSNNKSWTSIYVAMKYNLFPLYIYISTKENWNITRKTFCTMGPSFFQAFCTSLTPEKKLLSLWTSFFFVMLWTSPPPLNQSFLFFLFFSHFLCAWTSTYTYTCVCVFFHT